MEKHKPYRSFVWPILLIGAGIIWLLSTLNIIPSASIGALLSLWPLILIVIGLEILVGRRSAVASALIGVVTVALIIVVLIASPSLNLPGTGVMQNRLIVEPMGETTSAEIDLHLSSMPTRLYPLSGSQDLLRADIDYYGTLEYDAEDAPVRKITLNQRSETSSFRIYYDPTARWDIGLSPNVPIDLNIDGASGSTDIDLTGLDIESLWFDVGSGSFDVNLPMSPKEYSVTAFGGSGSLEVNLPEQTSLTFRLDGGSGSLHLNLPDNAGVRLEILKSGSGSVHFPSSFELVRGGDDKEGVWQSPGFDSAVYQLEIICDDLGSGSFTIR